MNEFVLFTDSACDIAPATLKEWKVESISLSLLFDGEDKEISNYDITATDFYKRMRDGDTAKTSAINVEGFKTAFETTLKSGKDVLYLGFSSGLSTTVNSARIAADELKEDYPNASVTVVDTLCASAGQGLLVYLAVKQRDEGKTLAEIAEYTEKTKVGMCHWFTVDDLVYLKRGGRISPTVAFVGGILGIKPVLHMDDEGHLISMSKARGRKNALKAIVDRFSELAVDKQNGTVFISHGDCIDDANELAGMLKDAFGVTVSIIADIGPVIGAHSGPGTLALFFVGKER